MLLSLLPLLVAASIPAGALDVPAGVPAAISSRGGVIRVTGPTPTSAMTGLSLNANKGITRFILDRGIYTSLKFKGSKGSDLLQLGPQAVVVTNQRGLNIDFGQDGVKDSFVFTNVHREDGPPLKHLQRSVIRNFGPEDEIVLQGRTFGYSDLGRDGTLPGVNRLTLRVEVLK